MSVRFYVCRFFVFFLALLYAVPAAATGVSLLDEEKTIPLPFASKPELDRGYIDLPVKNPEAVAKGNLFQIEFQCDDPAAIGSITFYLHSEKGWYSFTPERKTAAWDDPNRLIFTFSRTKFKEEGNPGPLNRADTLRFAIWRGKGVDATVRLKSIEVKTFPVLLLVPDKSEDFQAQRDLQNRMRRAGIPFGTLPQSDLSEEQLKTMKIVVLANHSHLTPQSVAMLQRFVANGGKLIAFYHIPDALAKSLGFQRGQYVKPPQDDTALADFRFEKSDSKENPFANLLKVEQKSWNINTATPLKDAANSHGSQIAAWWFDAAGRKTAYPALLLSDRGAYFSHILTNEDPENKDRFLLALFGYFDPSFLHQVSLDAWQKLFSVGDERFRTPEQRRTMEKEFLAELKQRGFDLDAAFFSRNPDSKAIRKILPKIEALNNTLREMHREAVVRFCRSIPPKTPEKTPEFRAWWEHAGLGAYPGDWDRTMQKLSENGFNAVISNLLWGGSAHYASDVIPRSKKFETYGDQVEQAIRAGKKYGVEVHAWQVCYWLNGSPQEYIEAMKKAGRTQKSSDGTLGEWLCPSHPKNIDLECETFCELVRKYPDLTGIHYDYIRYPDSDHCFCDGCRERFSAATDSQIANWPQDVLRRGELREKFLQWRCDNITYLVERVHREAKKIRPEIKISAAVFNSYPSCRNTIGQDWPLWVEKGWLDFICPMDYTENLNQFEGLVQRQKELIGNKIPLYPGIGATATGIAMSADRVAVEIEIVRREEAPGFVIFNLAKGTIEQIVPILGEGPTRKKD